MRASVLWLILCFFCITPACVGGGDGGSKSGEVTLTADTGVDLVAGEFQEKGNSTTSDIYATAGNSYLKLSSGGKITNPRPVNFFLGPGGVHQTFGSLAEVPEDFPEGSLNAALVHAKEGNAFVVEMSNGGYAKGWIRAASPTEVTLEYARIN